MIINKTLKKLTSFSLPNPVPYNEHDYEKQKVPETSDSRSSSYKTNLEISF